MIPTISFFHSKGGVGQTSLIYHLAWMYSDLGHRVLAVDLDPQANLTTLMIDEARLQELWKRPDRGTLYGGISPLMGGTGDITEPHRERIGDHLELLVGDLEISSLEEVLATEWAHCLARQERAFRVITAFHRCIQAAASAAHAEIVLIDLGPHLGAINRAALVASEYVVMPVAPELLSLQGLKNFGPVLRRWRAEWEARLPENPLSSLDLPKNAMQPAGYVVLRYSIYMGKPQQAHELWMSQIPEAYARYVLDTETEAKPPGQDRHCLGLLRRYESLMHMAQEARKPIFHLKAADGALGAHAAAARDARTDFKQVAERIAESTWLPKRPH